MHLKLKITPRCETHSYDLSWNAIHYKSVLIRGTNGSTSTFPYETDVLDALTVKSMGRPVARTHDPLLELIIVYGCLNYRRVIHKIPVNSPTCKRGTWLSNRKEHGSSNDSNLWPLARIKIICKDVLIIRGSFIKFLPPPRLKREAHDFPTVKNMGLPMARTRNL